MTSPLIQQTQQSWAPSYNVITVDLAVARTAERVVRVGEFFSTVYIKALPLGVVASIGIGENKPFIPIEQGETYELTDSCGNPRACTEGLFVSNPAGAGVLLLLVSYDGLGASS